MSLEIKFKHIDDKKYNRLLSRFKNGTQEYAKIAFDTDIKKRTIIDNHTTTWKNKKILKTTHYSLYDINEVSEYDVEEPNNFKSTYTRDKLQNQYNIDGYDLLVSKTLTKDKNIITNQYEIQINTNLSNQSDKLNYLIEELLMIMNDSNMAYTEEERLQLVKDCNFSLNVNNNQHIEKILAKSKNINDLTLPSIISTKSKGLRRMLIIHSSGIWLVNPPYDYNLLIRYDKDNFNYFINSWNLTIFDGDIITPINKTEYDFNYLYWFLCHDCIVFNKKDIRNNNYIDRIDKAKTYRSLITRYVNTNFLKFGLQTTRVINDISELSSKAKEILSLQEVLNYHHNGLTFTSVGKYQDIHHWIEPSSITFDLSIYSTGIPNQIQLYAYDDIEGKEVNIGNLIENDIILQQSFETYEDKKIGTCRYDNILEKFVLINIRDDKSQPDTVKMVLDNWKNIGNPITKC